MCVYIYVDYFSLDAAHDGTGNTCSADDQFVMAPSSGLTDTTTRGNPWKFSICSVETFDAFLTTLNKYVNT